MNLLGHELFLDQCSNLHIPGECRDLSPGESGQSEELSLSTQSANVSVCVCGLYVSVCMCVCGMYLCVCVCGVFLNNSPDLAHMRGLHWSSPTVVLLNH